ncbi:hypothetical protein V2I01_25050 [Micromonospora sp. BRA006-A]|nr:hypothetical protein [Micromonospora sp. BRA006-A]
MVTAIPLGLLIGWYRPLADLLSPLLEVFRNTAALAAAGLRAHPRTR